jgi:DNA-binding FadR family transcriptional regulator
MMHPLGKAETLVARTARALGELSLEHAAGDFLGAEEELLHRLGVSRPTLRQAAKIAENNRLVAVRRGVRGGIYAARPDANDAIGTLARFLRLRGAELKDVMAVSRLVLEEAAALSCDCPDEALRHKLLVHLERIDDCPDDTVRGTIERETAFAGLIAAMSGNPVMEVVIAIGFSFGMEEERSRLFDNPRFRAESRNMQRELCRAILDHDGDIARLLMRRRTDAFVRWLTDNGPATEFPPDMTAKPPG